MKKRVKRIGLSLVAVGLCIVLSLTAAIPVCEAGPNERVVKIGVASYFTGPIASCGIPGYYGIVDYLKLVNDQGGLDGVKLEGRWANTAQSPIPLLLTAHKRWKTEGVLIESAISNSHAYIAPTMQRDEIPAIPFAPYSTLMITEPEMWVFGTSAGLGPEFATFMKWVRDNWIEQRPPRIGIMLIDFEEGWETYEGSKHAAEIGVEFVGKEVIPVFGVIDTSVEWIRLANKNPDWIYVMHFGGSMAVLVKDAARLEIMKKGIKLCAGAGNLDEGVFRMVGGDADGWYQIYPFVCNGDDPQLPGMKAVLDAAKDNRGWEVEDVPQFYFVGWIVAKVIVEAIRLAIENVGFENLSGRAIRDGVCSIRDFDLGFGIPLVNVSDEKPYFIEVERMFRVEESRLWPIITDFLKPYYLNPRHLQ